MVSSSSTRLPVPSCLLPWVYLRWTYRGFRTSVWRLIDRRLGVDTTPPLASGPLADYRSDIPYFLPSGWLSLYRTFRGLRVTNSDVLLDVGCGSGRVALVAAMFPFRRVIGIDLDAHQIQCAQHNLRMCRVSSLAAVEFEHADALKYEIPDDVTVVYMYNPFGGSTFARFFERLAASLDRAPRRLRLVYANPVEHAFLAGTDRCDLVRRYRGLRPGRDWSRMLSVHIYELH